MLFRALADATVLLHGAFVLFVVFGGLLVLQWRAVAWFHLPAAAWGAWIELAGWLCPLTHLENWLRVRSGSRGSEMTFIDRYLMPVIYPPGLTPELQAILALALVVFNAAVYTIVLRRGYASRRP